jgi:hypothetical protein
MYKGLKNPLNYMSGVHGVHDVCGGSDDVTY